MVNGFGCALPMTTQDDHHLARKGSPALLQRWAKTFTGPSLRRLTFGGNITDTAPAPAGSPAPAQVSKPDNERPAATPPETPDHSHKDLHRIAPPARRATTARSSPASQQGWCGHFREH